MTTYFDSFSSLGHLQYGTVADVKPLKDSILNCFKGKDISGRKIYVSDENSLRLAMTFLFLLDHNAIPILVPVGFQIADEILIENLSWLSNKAGAQESVLSQRYMCLSSGTTGTPKHLMLSVERAFKNARAHADGFGINNEHTIVQTLPVYHSYGIIAYILTPLVTKARVDFNPGIIGLRSFKTDGKRVLHTSPPQARFILKDKFDKPQGLEKITIGAGTLSSQELESLQAKFPQISFYVSYGLTEAGPRVTAGQWNRSKNSNWIGQALSGIELGILEGSTVKSSGTGTLCIKSESLYLNAKSNEMQGPWLKTRDQVQINDRDVYFISRSDDIIKCGGVTLFPSEIENVFRNIEGVKDVLVLKEKDATYDEVPILFIEGNISKEIVENLSADHFSVATAPRKILILPQFPRQSLNKVDRVKLLQLMKESIE